MNRMETIMKSMILTAVLMSFTMVGFAQSSEASQQPTLNVNTVNAKSQSVSSSVRSATKVDESAIRTKHFRKEALKASGKRNGNRPTATREDGTEVTKRVNP